jgi:hypothetical protein
MSDRLEHLERLFPNLASVGYFLTSEQSDEYNCVAWAVGDTTRVWQGHRTTGYWPPGATEGFTIEALVSAFEQEGFAVCAGGDLETGFEKVALCADKQSCWQHAAKQLASGEWSSKIGEFEDIKHRTPHALIGSDYGWVYHFMKRPIKPAPTTTKATSDYGNEEIQ